MDGQTRIDQDFKAFNLSIESRAQMEREAIRKEFNALKEQAQKIG